mgnify:CR=1 FL=1
MFLRWAKNKVRKWVNSEAGKHAVVHYLIPLAISLLRVIAKKTENTIDNRMVDELDRWYVSWRARNE